MAELKRHEGGASRKHGNIVHCQWNIVDHFGEDREGNIRPKVSDGIEDAFTNYVKVILWQKTYMHFS